MCKIHIFRKSLINQVFIRFHSNPYENKDNVPNYPKPKIKDLGKVALHPVFARDASTMNVFMLYLWGNALLTKNIQKVQIW